MVFCSDELNMIFLVNQKCGSTSIRDFLINNVKDIQILQEIINDNARYDKHHNDAENAIEMCELLGKNYNSYFSFTTIRNPWSKTVSLYFFARPDKNNNPWYCDVYDESSAFANNFNKWLSEIDVCRFHGLTVDTFSIFNGKQLVTKIYPIETFTIKQFVNDLTAYNQKNGIHTPIYFDTNQILPVINCTEHNHYSTYYSKENIEKIRNHFADDIKIGGYCFEEMC